MRSKLSLNRFGASVWQMFERYKPNHGNGEEETNGSISNSVQESLPIIARTRVTVRSSSGGVPFGCEVNTAKR